MSEVSSWAYLFEGGVDKNLSSEGTHFVRMLNVHSEYSHCVWIHVELEGGREREGEREGGREGGREGEREGGREGEREIL